LSEHPGQGSQAARRARSRRVVGSASGASWAALEDFHRDFFLPLVWRATYRHGLSKEDARDIVQDAFVLAITELRADGNPRAWLNQVVDNLCANHRRKESRRTHLVSRWGLGDLAAEGLWEDVTEQDRE